MAKRRKSSNDSYPGWVWMLFGLAIGLSVAVAVFVQDRGPSAPAAVQQAASSPPAIDNNSEVTMPVAEKKESRFDFYEMLKKMEVEVDVAEPVVEEDNEPQAVVEAGTYLLQAGSFSRAEDAERRRAELALQGIESRVEMATPNGRVRHRVYIGPTSDLDELNLLRSRLRAAKIDVLRITVSD